MKNINNNLKKQYESICEKYINLFANKQNLNKDGWVDYVGGIYGFDTIYFISFDDIRIDIETNQPKGLIINWYQETLHNKDKMNYYTYTKGLRYNK